MRFREEGDSALMVLWPASSDPSIAFRAIALQKRLIDSSPAWLREAVPGACSLCVVFDPIRTDPAEVQAHVEKLGDAPDDPGQSRLVEIPVVYGGPDGPDVERVCEHTGLTAEEVFRRHAAGKYRVAFMGFSPGFAYLVGLPLELATPRVRSPRLRVPVGSVGIAYVHTGVYPGETAGGWNLIGRTCVRLVNWSQPDPFLLHPGDRVAFQPVPSHSHDHADRESTRPVIPHPVAELRASGLMTTVQDLGRPRHAHEGVPLSGAMDRIALRLANLAAGNSENTPALEFTIPGPRIRFIEDTSFALGGADFAPTLAGRSIPLYERLDARAGEELAFERRLSGHWAYLALAGGIAAKRYLGSAACDTRSGISARLSAGSRLGLEGPPPANGHTVPRDWAPMPVAEPVVRFFPSEDPNCEQLDGALVTLSVMQDRSGYRVESPTFPAGSASMLSEGVSPGTIQIPPEGRPIFLMADRPTTGGYPKFAFFASIDTRIIAQSPPGTKLRFRKITAAEGRKLIRDARHMIDTLGGA